MLPKRNLANKFWLGIVLLVMLISKSQLLKIDFVYLFSKNSFPNTSELTSINFKRLKLDLHKKPS